jgi:taurine dioxygenase
MRTEELTGIGMGLRLSGADLPGLGTADVEDLVHRHGVLVFSGVRMDDEAYVEFATRFGEPAEVFPALHQAPGSRHIRLQSSIPGYGVSAGGTYWHSDGPFNDPPTRLTFLLCDEAPPSGGRTLFADTRFAFERLPESLRALVEGRTGFFPCRRLTEANLRTARLIDAGAVSEEEVVRQLAKVRDVSLPLVRVHPRTGRRALYLNQRWLRSIDGMSEQDGERLLKSLYDVVTEERYLYAHGWTVGDLVIWCNDSVLHKAIPAPAGTRKITRRITV